MFIKPMSYEDCVSLLESCRLGRLACSHEGQPYVVPIYYAFSNNMLYSFTMPGRKVDWMRENPKVCVQAEKHGGPSEWRSVVLYGRYRELPDTGQWHQQHMTAWSLLERYVNWWEPGGLKPDTQAIAGKSVHIFYAIEPTEITGRMAVERAS
ncbi:pyridoxamine 5'-phosphate oxidase family protein [Sinorhizobium sp. BG8]|uniref:pyridoxamine 5'-phosphate oxidase family protein n=1 Tax=Sinorhizobium sp. BG8 TaxID=2613773 RepID=UPI00193E8FE1|nr:pyridoxamine 5'-phosphate oxidase family protein [Sinorhizobium sp. BG8]QRM55244.1 pyridoxamine 5'-phosphate oxidase family protein [Sinorhizobium sp. BG8]